jgi:dTDP-4-dehydrorhamnose reductase
VDIVDEEAIRAVVSGCRPQIVLHTAAFTDVDAAESNPDRAMAVNAAGTRNVALACRDVGARLIYYSTDHVFSGDKTAPYTEDDAPGPINLYGRSKLAGEKLLAEIMDDFAILRIAWLYGHGGRNFVNAIVSLASSWSQRRAGSLQPEPLRVVDDQFGCPCSTIEVARQTMVVLEHDLTGLFHATAEGSCSRYELARAILEIAGKAAPVVPCKTVDIPRPARRPAYAVLENARLKASGHDVMRPWREALEEFFTGDQGDR